MNEDSLIIPAIPFRRDPMVIGDYRVSIQASEYAYCAPRVSGMPLEYYTHLEVAIFGPEHTVTLVDYDGTIETVTTDWWTPEQLGMPHNYRFEEGGHPVGGYITQAEVLEIVEFLRDLAEKES